MPPNPRFRDALFSVADRRGNNPHGTREDPVSEGRRLNAQRYETVEQMDRALDARSRPMPPLGNVPAAQPAAQPASDPGLALVGLALGAAVTYLIFKSKSKTSKQGAVEVIEGESSAPSGAPVALPTQTLVVHTAPMSNPAPAAATTVVVEQPKKRRRRKKAEIIAAPAVVTTTVTPTPEV